MDLISRCFFINPVVETIKLYLYIFQTYYVARGILIFRLPEEDYEHKCAVNATRTQYELHDIDEWLRRLLKRGNINKFTADELAEEIRNKLSEIKIEEG